MINTVQKGRDFGQKSRSWGEEKTRIILELEVGSWKSRRVNVRVQGVKIQACFFLCCPAAVPPGWMFDAVAPDGESPFILAGAHSSPKTATRDTQTGQSASDPVPERGDLKL